MDLYQRLNSSNQFIDFFCEVLEESITPKIGYKVVVSYKKHDKSIFFFIDSSSILQIMPDKDLQYTYAHTASYEKEIKKAIRTIEKQWNRETIINQIIKKES